jgi:transposase
LALADWLRSWQVADVAMESTSDYWKAPFFRLEAEGFECVLLDAKQVKALPGRPKTDRVDCAWLARNFERGMVASCFVATEQFRRLRTLTRPEEVGRDGRSTSSTDRLHPATSGYIRLPHDPIPTTRTTAFGDLVR